MKLIAAISIIFASIWLAEAATANRGERIEAALGTPTAIEAEHAGYVRGHCGNFTAWVGEYLSDKSIDGKVARDGFDFVEDPDTAKEFRARHKHYRGSGYDAGHLPASANHHGDAMEMRDCFRFSAITPQTPQLNRQASAWAGLEDHYRRVKKSGAEVWLFTGPAFLPGKAGEIHVKTLGGVVWIGTHCWKVAAVKRGDSITLEGWLMPNTADPPAWKNCRVSIDEIETATGLDFFDRLPDELEDELEANAT
jgi:endonuclease G, mitochondrial